MTPEPEMRIGDADREAAATALGEHYASGRLTKQEYDERAEVVWSAKTGSDLRPVFVDLPSGHASPPRPAATRTRTRRRPPWAGLPLVPMLIALVVLTAVFSGAAWLLFVLVWVFFCGPWRSWARHGSVSRRC